MPVVTLEIKKKTWIVTSDICGKLLSGAAKYRENKVNPNMTLIERAEIQNNLSRVQPKVVPIEVKAEKVLHMV